MSQCPHCYLALDLSQTPPGHVVACPQCGGQFSIPITPPPSPQMWADFSSLNSLVQTAASRASQKINSGRTSSQRITWSAIIGAAVGGVALVAIAIPVSQFWPMYGGFMGLIAQPFSPARLHYLPHHIFGFGASGLVAGAILGGLRQYLK